MTGGAVVVLGPVGPNFAAGMSGGEAYLLVTDEPLEHRLNTAMVRTEDVSDERDRALLTRLLENHAAMTGSERARSLLAEGSELARRFVKIVPQEYAAVLDAAASRGEDLRMPLPPTRTTGGERPDHEPATAAAVLKNSE